MRTLTIPPAAQRDEKAIQMLSAWIAEKGLHCTLKVGMWHAQGRDEPKAWGILLADLIRHIGNAIQEEHGKPATDTIEAVLAALTAELEEPTSDAKGQFTPGHS